MTFFLGFILGLSLGLTILLALAIYGYLCQPEHPGFIRYPRYPKELNEKSSS